MRTTADLAWRPKPQPASPLPEQKQAMFSCSKPHWNMDLFFFFKNNFHVFLSSQTIPTMFMPGKGNEGRQEDAHFFLHKRFSKQTY